MGETTQHFVLLLLCLSGLVHSSAAFVFWTAVVDISYYNNITNDTEENFCECGVYGQNARVETTSGIVVLPRDDPKGCHPDTVYNWTSSPWIALVKRGSCNFSEKIIAAVEQGASGVVVYNADGTGNSTSHMSHPEAAGVVAIMIGNIQGMEIVKLVNNGTDVYMTIDVGSPHGPWITSYWLYFLSLAFFIVTTASIAYFVFISANRLYNLRMHKRSERKLRSEAKKAIGRLQVRNLKRDDEITNSEAHMCAVCIEAYKVGDVVTVLTCDHIFHKTCIEPWLLERRTCPMCKCDILKALGVEEESKDSITTTLPQDATVITVAGGDSLFEVPLTEPVRSDPERQQHRYDNRAFEGDTEGRE